MNYLGRLWCKLFGHSDKTVEVEGYPEMCACARCLALFWKQEVSGDSED